MLITATGTAAAVLLAAPLSALALLRRMHASVGTAPPTQAMLAEERATDCALFRHFPPLRQKLAWRSLGAIPTAVHRGAVTDPISGRRLSFEVKREDLISSEYGGNKVRTLQHQLAVCEAKIERASSAAERTRLENLLVIGTGGSNQVVATLVHAGRAKLANINVAWLQPDQPDLDNSLNMLSTLSLPLGGSRGTWGRPAPMAAELLRACLGGGVALPLGGNNPSGVLGQAGGALELAEQIERGGSVFPEERADRVVILARHQFLGVFRPVFGIALQPLDFRVELAVRVPKTGSEVRVDPFIDSAIEEHPEPLPRLHHVRVGVVYNAPFDIGHDRLLPE